MDVLVKDKEMANTGQNKLIKNSFGINSWTLDNLFYLKLREIYDMEARLMKAIPQMVKKSADKELKHLFETHLAETAKQVERAEDSFRILERKAGKIQGAAIRGLEIDIKMKMAGIKDEDALDASLIAAGASVEHYEMACYITAIEWAKLIGEYEIVALLTASLKEEMGAEAKLSNLATLKINAKVKR